MFGVIKEDKTWYLTIAGNGKGAGKILRFAKLGKKPALHIGFRTKAIATKCARDLNKDYWELFNKADHKSSKMGKQATAMLETIKGHMAI